MSSYGGLDEEQRQFMAQEMIALLDHDDNVIGKASKRECHERTAKFPNGRLHRAFSVFLFNSKNELLLQRRADSKITFPGLWTNTCCSHPLHVEEELAPESHVGIKRAAIRKLEHELGIKLSSFSLEDFRFLTRIEYQAFQDQNWTENEIDYILFVKSDVELHLNPNEVSHIRYVGMDELKDMMLPQSENAVPLTPWFELIAQQHLFSWWGDLEQILERGGLEDKDAANRIHRMGLHKPDTK